jgi:hypothetical protein
MRHLAVLLLCAGVLVAVVTNASARTRLWVHRSGPSVIVVPNPAGYGEPQVLVRRYELVWDQYVAPPGYLRATFRRCAYVHRACSAYRPR